MDLEAYKRELMTKPGADRLKALAESEDTARLAAWFDGAALEEAARRGDGETLSRMLRELLATDEGRDFAVRVRKAMGKDGR